MVRNTKKAERAARELKRRKIRRKLRAKQRAKHGGLNRKTKTHPHRKSSALKNVR